MPDTTAQVTIQSLWKRSLSPYVAALEEMIRVQSAITLRVLHRAYGLQMPPPTNPEDVDRSLARLGKVMADTMGVADMLGREQAWRYAARMLREQQFAERNPSPVPDQAILPSVTFDEAVADIVARAPVVVSGAAGRAAEAVSRVYTTQHGIAFARSSSMAVTDKVQGIIQAALQRGMDLPTVEKIITDATDWTRAYAANAYRTNVATAYSTGRMVQAADKDIARVIGALRYTAVGDADTRPNHLAADGIIGTPFDPVWDKMRPPSGFACRCGLDFVNRVRLRSLGLMDASGNVKPAILPPGAHPDPGFALGPNPLRAHYGY